MDFVIGMFIGGLLIILIGIASKWIAHRRWSRYL